MLCCCDLAATILIKKSLRYVPSALSNSTWHLTPCAIVQWPSSSRLSPSRSSAFVLGRRRRATPTTHIAPRKIPCNEEFPHCRFVQTGLATVLSSHVMRRQHNQLANPIQHDANGAIQSGVRTRHVQAARASAHAEDADDGTQKASMRFAPKGMFQMMLTHRHMPTQSDADAERR